MLFSPFPPLKKLYVATGLVCERKKQCWEVVSSLLISVCHVCSRQGITEGDNFNTAKPIDCKLTNNRSQWTGVEIYAF